jgi:hypothetical protein
MDCLRWVCTVYILLCFRGASLQTLKEELNQVALANGVVGMSVISVCNGFIAIADNY